MRVTLFGTRGSVARAGPETVRYGGDTASVEIRGANGSLLVIDAGTGIVGLGSRLPGELRRVDVLLSHLHMDHIQGLGFFRPIYDPAIEVHLWGPVSTTASNLRRRLTRYLSPPLFPVRLRDLPALTLHEMYPGSYEIGEFRVTADLVIHPGPTLGFRVENGGATVAYLSDHEPALGNPTFPATPDWTSGWSIAHRADLLIHDAQYTRPEYAARVGWGHSTMHHAAEFARQAEVETLVTFHHDPEHSDEFLDAVLGELIADTEPSFALVPGTAGASFALH